MIDHWVYKNQNPWLNSHYHGNGIYCQLILVLTITSIETALQKWQRHMHLAVRCMLLYTVGGPRVPIAHCFCIVLSLHSCTTEVGILVPIISLHMLLDWKCLLHVQAHYLPHGISLSTPNTEWSSICCLLWYSHPVCLSSTCFSKGLSPFKLNRHLLKKGRMSSWQEERNSSESSGGVICVTV